MRKRKQNKELRKKWGLIILQNPTKQKYFYYFTFHFSIFVNGFHQNLSLVFGETN